MDKNLLWKKAIDDIRLEVSENTFNSFFKNTTISLLDDSQIVISCSNSGVSFVLQNKYRDLINKIINKYRSDAPNKLVFQAITTAKLTRKDAPLFVARADTIEEKIIKAGLSPNLSFESFAVSVSNEMAHATTLAVAKTPGKLYNPLFLWGGVGVGKTHLLNAIGKKIMEDSKKTVLLCSAEDFTNSLVEAIRNKNTNNFRKRFRRIDVLLLDDIQFISEREFVQEELFHTFNKLRSLNKQVVFTSDKPPKYIKKVENRLVSRFLSGLIVDIQKPDFELKTAILLIKAREREITLDIEVAKTISSSLEEIREIEGFLLKLEMLKNSGKEIKKEVIEKLLLQSSINKQKTVTSKDIIRAVTKEMGISLKDIKQDNRKKHIVLARHLIMYLLKISTDLPYEDIARLLGKKDHTTVMHGVQKIINLIPKDESLRKQIEVIKSYFA